MRRDRPRKYWAIVDSRGYFAIHAYRVPMFWYRRHALTHCGQGERVISVVLNMRELQKKKQP